MAKKAHDMKGDASRAKASQHFLKPAMAEIECWTCVNCFHVPGSPRFLEQHACHRCGSTGSALKHVGSFSEATNIPPFWCEIGTVGPVSITWGLELQHRLFVHAARRLSTDAEGGGRAGGRGAHSKILS